MSSSKVFLAAALAAAVAASAPVAAATQTNGVTIDLHLLGSPTTNCQFITDDRGVRVDESDASTIDAWGVFAGNSSCGLGGNNSTGPAQITMSGPANIILDQADSVPDSIQFHWSATADACQFSGSSLNGAQVPNWKEAGYACVGAAACADPNNLDPEHSISYTFANAGIYKFQLTCFSGWSNGQPDTVSEIKTVTVQGSQPPVGSCTGPAGTTRQTVVTVGQMSGAYNEYNVPGIDTWADIFGEGWIPGATPIRWPGLKNTGAKLYIKNNHFVSLRFRVPDGMPLATSANGWTPHGSFDTNRSAVTYGMTWAITISETCGDFNKPAVGSSDSACYSEFTYPASPTLSWAVTGPSERAPACNLDPGTTYYLNIMPASLDNPSNGLCTQGECRLNLQNMGNFQSGSACTGAWCP